MNILIKLLVDANISTLFITRLFFVYKPKKFVPIQYFSPFLNKALEKEILSLNFYIFYTICKNKKKINGYKKTA